MLLILAALQAAPATPPAAPNMEQRARQGLAAAGMSPAGVNIFIAAEKRHAPALAGILQRGRSAELNLRQVLAKQPVDPQAFAAAVSARAEAVAAIQREGATLAGEQMRALSPADRGVLARKLLEAMRGRPPAGAK